MSSSAEPELNLWACVMAAYLWVEAKHVTITVPCNLGWDDPHTCEVPFGDMTLLLFGSGLMTALFA